MRSPRPTMRNFALYAVGLVATIVLFGPIGEFFIEFAREQGAYENPSRKLSAVNGFVTSMVASYPFAILAGIVLGFAGGVWVDAFLKKRDSPLDTTEAREALAVRATELAKSVSAIVGRTSAQVEIAHSKARAAWKPGETQPDHSEAATIKSHGVEQYGMAYHTDVMMVVQEAGKHLTVSSFFLRNWLSSGDLAQIVSYLTQIAVDLRSQTPDAVPRSQYDALVATYTKQTDELRSLRGD